MHSTARKAVPGYWKDETAGKPIREVVCLKSKVYTVRVGEGAAPIKKCKGVKKNIVANFSLADYRTCVQTITEMQATQKRIASRNFKLTTLECRRRSLTSFDDKRDMFSCGRHSWPYGPSIPSQCPYCQ